MIEFPPALFADAFPFHIVFDDALIVRQVGRSIGRILPEIVPGADLRSALRIEYPAVPFTFAALMQCRDMLVITVSVDERVRLRGEIALVSDQGLAVFLASPWVTDTSDLARLNLTISDFARHDAVVDILQSIQTHKVALGDLRKLAERLTAQRTELRQANAALINEVAERKRAETGLREREERFRTLLTAASEAVVIADARGVIMMANASAETLFGYEHAELNGQLIEVLVPAALRHSHAAHRDAFVQHPRMRRMGGGMLLSGRHKNGATIPLEISLSHVDTAEGMLVMAFLTDVTERQRSAEEIRAQRDFAQQVMGAMGQGLIVTTVDMRFEYVNPAFAALVGAAPDELLGRSALELVAEADRERLAAVYATAASRQSSDVEAHLWGAGGQSIPVLLTCVPWHREGGSSSTITVVTNLSERKQIEQATIWARDRALEASRLKSDFLASVSHEIRTPLNSIIGVAELLAETALDRDQTELISLIEESGKVLLALINDILDFSKIEAGKLVLESRPFGLRDLVEAALSVVRTDAARKGLHLAYVMEQPVPRTVTGDENRLSQILINLLGNAVKFTDHGDVTVTVSTVRSPQPSERAEVQFSVHDSGIGIPPQRQKRLFQAFSQMDASTSRRYGGTGLGLAISRRLCEAMGGHMWVESSGIRGEGATFHFSIPYGVEVWEATTPGDLVMAGKRMLLVRSPNLHPIEAHHVTLLAQACRMEVATVDSIEAAHGMVARERVDVVLVDELDAPANVAGWPPLLVLLTLGNRPGHDDPHTTFLTKPTKASALRAALRHSVANGVVHRPDQPTGAVVFAPASPVAALLRILVVEDTPVNQVVIRRMLERLGYTPDLAASGIEALAAVEARAYDLILMDMQMPDMDGLEATRRIRMFERDSAAPRAHIIALTANATPEDRSACFDAGMDGFLSKPIRIGELRTTLEEAAALIAAAV